MYARLPSGDDLSGTLVGWPFDAPAGTEIVGDRISPSVGSAPRPRVGAAPPYYPTCPRLDPADIRERCARPTCDALVRRDRAVRGKIVV